MRQLGSSKIRRRSLLKSGAAATGFAAAGLLPSGGFAQAKTQTVNLQLGWLAGNNQIGEIAAKGMGFFEEEKLNVVIQPGGPSIDGVAIVASGRHEIGQVSSSPSLMLAASQKIPVMCFATGLQQHPYAYFSLPKKPVRTAKDLVGKKVGIQATAKVLLNALMKKHNIAEKAAAFLVKEYPNLNLADEVEGSKVLLTFAFNANTQANGWGAFDPGVWQEQITLYDELKQFTAGAPKLQDVMTTKNLDATKSVRA